MKSHYEFNFFLQKEKKSPKFFVVVSFIDFYWISLTHTYPHRYLVYRQPDHIPFVEHYKLQWVSVPLHSRIVGQPDKLAQLQQLWKKNSTKKNSQFFFHPKIFMMFTQKIIYHLVIHKFSHRNSYTRKNIEIKMWHHRRNIDRIDAITKVLILFDASHWKVRIWAGSLHSEFILTRIVYHHV